MKSNARAAITLFASNLDLVLLGIAGAAVTALGAFGVASQTALSSTIFAMLGLLAISQIRSRRQIAGFAASSSVADRFLFDSLDQEIDEAFGRSSRFMYVGVSMAREVASRENHLRRILRNGGEVRVLLLNPNNSPIIASSDLHSPVPYEERQAQRIADVLRYLSSLQSEMRGRVELRVVDYVPRIAIHAFDTSNPSSAVLFVRHLEHRPRNDQEPQPIFRLRPRDGRWYRHFVDEADRMWEGAKRVSECTVPTHEVT